MNEYEQKVMAEAEEIRRRYLGDRDTKYADSQVDRSGLRGDIGCGAALAPRLTNQDLTDNHSPGPEQIQRITTIRAAARNFLDAIDANCPGCADRTSARRKVREAMMLANASIALNGAV